MYELSLVVLNLQDAFHQSCSISISFAYLYQLVYRLCFCALKDLVVDDVFIGPSILRRILGVRHPDHVVELKSSYNGVVQIKITRSRRLLQGLFTLIYDLKPKVDSLVVCSSLQSCNVVDEVFENQRVTFQFKQPESDSVHIEKLLIVEVGGTFDLFFLHENRHTTILFDMLLFHDTTIFTLEGIVILIYEN